MDSTRFDTISRLFADRRTRRSTLKGGAAGLAAAALLPFAARAQDGTPEVATPAVDPNDPHPNADEAKPDPEFLFVQPFQGGTWAPKDGEDGVYALTLTGAAASTVYFSDRPERIVGLSPMQDFLDTLGFSPANPPNAALVAQTDDGEQEILVIELLTPVYDGDTLTYDARVLADYGEHGLAHLAQQQTDFEHPESFGDGGLFIDGCSDGEGSCYQIVDGQMMVVGSLDIGRCYSANLGCGPCNTDGRSDYYGRRCADKYPDQCHAGYSAATNAYSWDCYAGRNCNVGDPGPCW